ncbi:sigma-70 family RNA polymerase sigma factor [Puniceicoccus vermicola]|uniref:RNA polymerase sigma factor n=1 Tax=Puniceicoccus vermicola TaxID=388746 RepID=A0A7X1E3W4_9BACT|nr:sigma-70 family RNA polymerase sigma factor [Puniceicoccus vermicola]MBC2601491.1 sigma-70 family RNA polymerase sigma factor [Puniceicoccus vermicola]
MPPPKKRSSRDKSEGPKKPEKEFQVRRSVETYDDQPEDIRNLPSSEKSALKLYLQEIGRTPLLKPEEEVALARKIQKGDEEARNKMVQANLRLVVKIAHDYNNFGLPLLDLISEGNIGLVKAVERFDPDKGGKLSTYAAWWIKQSIKRALANQSKTIRLPVHLVDRIAKMRKITSALADEFGREPNDDEIAAEMGIPVNKVAHLKSVSVRPTSLDAPIGDDENTSFGQLIGDENAINPFDTLRTKSQRIDLDEILDDLEEREAQIIKLRFGVGNEGPLTLEEVGEKFDITRERVRQLQNIAISKMRRNMMGRERQRTAEEIQEENLEKKRMQVLHEFYKKTMSQEEK